MNTQSYTDFLWHSANAHGVHSPFVYTFVSRYLYGKAPGLSRREYKELDTSVSFEEARLLFKLLQLCKPSKLFVLGDDSAVVTETLRKLGELNRSQLWFFSPLAPIPGAVDMVYLSSAGTESLITLFNDVLPNTNEKSIILIGGIHKTLQRERAWEALKKDPKVTVTIDTYFMGLVFRRHGQAKEHFLIRTTTSKFTDFLLGIRKLWGLLH